MARFVALLACAGLRAVAEAAGIAANKALDASQAFSSLEQWAAHQGRSGVAK